MTTDNLVPLHGPDAAPTAWERHAFEQAWDKLDNGEPIAMSDLAGELVRLGVPTTERATLVIEAHFFAGGLPPLDIGGKPSLRWLIQRYASIITDSKALADKIWSYHPEATIPEIIAELQRQAAENEAEADALRAYRDGRRN